MPLKLTRIYQLPRLATPATELVGARYEVDVPLGPVPGGFVSKQVTQEELTALIGGGSTAPSNLLDPYNVPLEVRNYVVDDSRVWFGPPGGEAIYLADDLPATARPGHTWDDPDANVNYLIFPVAFADRTVITCRRTALIAPTP